VQRAVARQVIDMSLAARMKTVATILTEQGPARLLRYTAHRPVESYHEHQFGVDTGKDLMLDSLGIHDPDAVRSRARLAAKPR
jgi:hypothetical protein